MEGCPERGRDLPKATQLGQDAALAPTALPEDSEPFCEGSVLVASAGPEGTLPVNTMCTGSLFNLGK